MKKFIPLSFFIAMNASPTISTQGINISHNNRDAAIVRNNESRKINDINERTKKMYALEQKIDETTETIESILDDIAGCDICSEVNSLTSSLDVLNVCDLCSQVVTLNSKIDSVISITDCTLDLLCDFVITQSNIPFTITQSGVYCLKEDITATSTAITVNATNVVLDLQDHTIFGPGLTADGIVIRGIMGSTLTDIQIKNGTVRGFYSGFYVLGTPTAPIVNLIFERCISGSNVYCGFLTERGNSITYNQCIARNNLVAGFFDLNLSRNTTYFRCLATTNGFNRTATLTEGGFMTANTNDVTYRYCKAQNNLSNGFSFAPAATILSQGPNRVLVAECEAFGNFANGIHIGAGQNIKIKNSEAIDNNIDGFFFGTLAFIFGLKNNNAITCGRHGFTFTNTTGSRGSLILSNNAIGNTGNGFNNTGSSPMTRNKFYNNTAVSNLGGNYAGISSADIASTSTATFWANIDTV